MTHGKIPVGATVFGAYGLVFRFWRPVLKISWLPVVLMSLVAIWPLSRFPNRDLSRLERHELDRVFSIYDGLGIASSGLTFLLGVMLFVGLFRFFFREEAPRLPLYLHWGKDEWRTTSSVLMGALMLIVVFGVAAFAVLFVYLVLYLLLSLGGLLPDLTSLADISSIQDAGGAVLLTVLFILVGIAVLALVGLYVWMTMRIYFFYPGPVAEGKVDVTRFWSLSQGHAGRLFLITLLWGAIAYGIVVVIYLVLDLTVFGGAMTEYARLLFWMREFQTLGVDPWENMSVFMVAGFVFNLLLKIPVVFSSGLYALIYLHRVRLDEAEIG